MAYCVYCGSGEAERFCTNCGKEQPQQARRRKSLKISKKALLITTAILVVLGFGAQQAITRLVLPYSGPLQIELSNTSSGNEVSSVLYRVIVDDQRATIPSFGRTSGLEYEWSSDQEIKLQVTSKLMGERDLTLTFDPKSIGTFGINPGSVVRIEVAFKEKTAEAKIEIADNPDSNNWTVVDQDIMQRSNFTEKVQLCVDNNEKVSQEAVAYAEDAYRSYEVALAKARLDGERDLYYYEWEDRAKRLANLLQDEIDAAPEFKADVGVDQWRTFIRGFREARDSWEYLADVSNREADDEWDPAWNRIRDAESFLASAARQYALAGGNTYESCLATLYK